MDLSGQSYKESDPKNLQASANIQLIYKTVKFNRNQCVTRAENIEESIQTITFKYSSIFFFSVSISFFDQFPIFTLTPKL